MNSEEIKRLLNKAKFCISHQIPVQLQWGEYIPAALVLRYVNQEWLYTVEMQDKKRMDTTITIGLEDVDWPTAGGGFICKE